MANTENEFISTLISKEDYNKAELDILNNMRLAGGSFSAGTNASLINLKLMDLHNVNRPIRVGFYGMFS